MADRWIDDSPSKRLDAEYAYAEKRMSYNLANQNWAIAERWALYASALCEVAQVVCFSHDEEQADA